MPLNNGDQFAGFTIQRLLGAGGMGEVYLAQHPRLPRLDALKILSMDATDNEEFRARFTREAELAATLWHPHIVGVHDRGEFDGRLWISMDYVEGTDARHLVEQRYPTGMPHPDVVEIVTAVAEALDFAHERRLLHRDVKPANILVTTPSDTARRRVLLTDFGIAREADDISGITEEGMAVGTVAYAAPEQLTGKSLGGRVDQYALAATAFHLLTGAPPFDSPNRAVVVGDHLHTPPPRLSERRPDLAHLDAVMTKALAKRPDDRYPLCRDFAVALSVPPDAAAADSGVHTAPLDAADIPVRSSPHHTKRLERMTVLGTARAVQKTPAESGGGQEMWSFSVERYDSTGTARTVVPVELRGDSITGELADGDVIEVTGFWDDHTLLADAVVNQSAATRRRRPSDGFEVTSGMSSKWKSRTAGVVAVVAVLAVIATAAAFTSGFGLWSGSDLEPIVKPERATVFSPGEIPDHPAQAGLAIDGDPNTSWPTDIYRDAVPFPVFKEGVGLLLHLSEPTGLAEVTIDVPSTGTEVQIRAADTAMPASLSDTVELTPSVTLQPGHNTVRRQPHEDVRRAGVDHQVGHDRRAEPHERLRHHAEGRNLTRAAYASFWWLLVDRSAACTSAETGHERGRYDVGIVGSPEGLTRRPAADVRQDDCRGAAAGFGHAVADAEAPGSARPDHPHTKRCRRALDRHRTHRRRGGLANPCTRDTPCSRRTSRRRHGRARGFASGADQRQLGRPRGWRTRDLRPELTGGIMASAKPTPAQFIAYVYGRCLPDSMRTWVTHDLAGRGAVRRHMVRAALPALLVLASLWLLPASPYVHLEMTVPIFIWVVLMSLALNKVWRRHRLAQHGLDPNLVDTMRRKRDAHLHEDYVRRYGPRPELAKWQANSSPF